MAPVIMALQARNMPVKVLSTAQHRHMVNPLLAHFGILPDLDLDAMTENQSLAALTARLLERLTDVFQHEQPRLVLAQGDTTTVFATALACFYAGIPFGHVEAGLRTHDISQPFPEEFNRVAVSVTAALHFAPTPGAAQNLLDEGKPPYRVLCTGNTVIDALLWTADGRTQPLPFRLKDGSRVILVTVHRRESFGAPVREILGAVAQIVRDNDDVEVVYPVHPNPNVRDMAMEVLGALPRVHLCEPLPYPQLVGALKRCHLALTDSGGIQEEAPSLAKPVLVVRETTERPEAIERGVAELLGADGARIRARVQQLLDDPAAYAAMARGSSPYGDGKASGRIADAVQQFLQTPP